MKKSKASHEKRIRSHSSGLRKMKGRESKEFEIEYYNENLPKMLNETALMRIIRDEGIFPQNFIEDLELVVPHPFQGAYSFGRLNNYGRVDLKARYHGKTWLIEVKGRHKGQEKDRLNILFSSMKVVLYTEIYNLSSRERAYPAIMTPSEVLDPIVCTALYKAKIGYIKYKRDGNYLLFSIRGLT